MEFHGHKIIPQLWATKWNTSNQERIYDGKKEWRINKNPERKTKYNNKIYYRNHNNDVGSNHNIRNIDNSMEMQKFKKGDKNHSQKRHITNVRRINNNIIGHNNNLNDPNQQFFNNSLLFFYEQQKNN